MSPWSYIIRPPASIPRCVLGRRNGLASTCITPPHLVLVADSGGALIRLITHKAIRRGSFRSVKELVQKIDDCVQHYNHKQRSFACTAGPIPFFRRSLDFVQVSPEPDTRGSKDSYFQTPSRLARRIVVPVPGVTPLIIRICLCRKLV